MAYGRRETAKVFTRAQLSSGASRDARGDPRAYRLSLLVVPSSDESTFHVPPNERTLLSLGDLPVWSGYAFPPWLATQPQLMKINDRYCNNGDVGKGDLGYLFCNVWSHIPC